MVCLKVLSFMLFEKLTKYLRSRGSRGEEQERGNSEDGSEHFEAEKVLKIGTDSDYQPAAVSRYSGATSAPTFFYTNCCNG